MRLFWILFFATISILILTIVPLMLDMDSDVIVVAGVLLIISAIWFAVTKHITIFKLMGFVENPETEKKGEVENENE